MQNTVLRARRVLWRRPYSTAYSQPQSSRLDYELPPSAAKPRPTTSSFFTGRSPFMDTIAALQTTKQSVERTLTDAHLLPPPLVPIFFKPHDVQKPLWQNHEKLAQTLGIPNLRTRQYRDIITLADELHKLRVVAASGGMQPVARQIANILSTIEREDSATILATKPQGVQVDKFGRTYALGRRKESSARVWVIPAKPQPRGPPVEETLAKAEAALLASTPSQPSPSSLTPATPSAGSAAVKASEASTPSDPSPADEAAPAQLSPTSVLTNKTRKLLLRANPPLTPSVGTVLINNIPLAQYFPNVADREKVMLPFKTTGTVGKYNVFALARGGGTTGQAGAIALGIAKGIKALFPVVTPILNKAGLLRRDPRMVERKKTGLAKARKAYTWVKR